MSRQIFAVLASAKHFGSLNVENFEILASKFKLLINLNLVAKFRLLINLNLAGRA